MEIAGFQHCKLSVVGDTADGVKTRKLDCKFNPTQYSISKAADWTPKVTLKSFKQEFKGSKPRTLKMKLLFDAWEDPAHNLTADIEALFSWMEPAPGTLNGGKKAHPRPPTVQITWGDNHTFFDALLKQADAEFILFHPNGKPARATVSVTLEENSHEYKKQNPTSGGPGGIATHVLVEGETLQSVAFDQYQDPSLWRGLAEANAIDNPLRLRPGTELLVPDREEAMRLGAGPDR